jgi:hypothetical protein
MAAWPGAHAHPELANVALLELRAGLAQLIGLIHQPPGALHKVLAEVGQLIFSPDAVKQALPQFVFQRLDAAAQGRLRDEELAGRLTEGATAGEFDQMLELNQGHVKSMYA